MLRGAGRVVAVAIACALPVACGAGANSQGWVALHNSKLRRSEVGGARIGSSIYVVGGFDGARNGRTTAGVERYDIESNRWRVVRAMPVALNHAAAAAYRGRLYVVGGYSSRSGLAQPTKVLLRYDPNRDSWKRLRDMHAKRAALAAAVAGNRLYAVGGANGGHALATAEAYDFETDRWHRLPDMPTAREHLTAAALGGAVYVLAGRAHGHGNYAVAERFDPSTNRWTRLPDMQKPRGGIACGVVAGRIVVFGGEEGAGTIRQVERYDPATRSWSRLADMRTPRHGLAGASYKGRVYALEGGRAPGLNTSRVIEALDAR